MTADPVAAAHAALEAKPSSQTVGQLRSLLAGLLRAHANVSALCEQVKRARDEWRQTAEVRKTETLTILMAKAIEITRLLDELDVLRRAAGR